MGWSGRERRKDPRGRGRRQADARLDDPEIVDALAAASASGHPAAASRTALRAGLLVKIALPLALVAFAPGLYADIELSSQINQINQVRAQRVADVNRAVIDNCRTGEATKATLRKIIIDGYRTAVVAYPRLFPRAKYGTLADELLLLIRRSDFGVMPDGKLGSPEHPYGVGGAMIRLRPEKCKPPLPSR